MKGLKQFYVAKFRGKIKKYIRVESFSIEEAIEDILTRVPQKDEGYVKIYKVNFITSKSVLVKKILILCELFMQKQEEKPVIHY
ncbi:MAG: hypothetical protein BAJALOKI3v1_100063 [Promethearchaeota archaeon]|nr:MAG: hypothetical protein BAJALOKI3v1_100063 [Candidatus Lokiarchaeota archaeon]